MPVIQTKQYNSSGGGITPNNVVYVSPNFPDIHPFYSSIATANLYYNNTTVIRVFPGTYSMAFQTNNVIYCEPGVILVSQAENNRLDISNNGALLGYAQLHYMHANCDTWVHVGVGYPEYMPRFECDSITYGGNATRETSGNMMIIGVADRPQTIRVRDLNCRVINECVVYGGEYAQRERLNIECDYLYYYVQNYDEYRTNFPHASILAKEFTCVEINQGTCVVDFAINHSLDPAARVRRQSSLTLRNGTIFANGTSADYNAQLECLSKYDTPVLRLEQVSMYNAKGCNVQMASLAGTWAKLIIKNCTFVADANSLGNIVGDNATTCHVINGAGNSSGNVGLNLVTEYVNSMLFDPTLEV